MMGRFLSCKILGKALVVKDGHLVTGHQRLKTTWYRKFYCNQIIRFKWCLRILFFQSHHRFTVNNQQNSKFLELEKQILSKEIRIECSKLQPAVEGCETKVEEVRLVARVQLHRGRRAKTWWQESLQQSDDKVPKQLKIVSFNLLLTR